MKKLVRIDFLIMLCAYIAIASFPINYFTSDLIIQNFTRGVLKIAYVIFILIYLAKLGLIEKREKNLKYLLILLPAYLACFSNLSVGLFTSSLDFSLFDGARFISALFLSLATAISEDLLFRYALFKSFVDKTAIKRIIYSSAIFGATHLLNFFSGFNPVVFVQVVYTFGIGLVLGLLYEYGGSVTFSIVFHFLFNGLNSDLYTLVGNNVDNKIYYLINILFGVFVGIYCVVIYLLVLRKRDNLKGEENVTKDMDI